MSNNATTVQSQISSNGTFEIKHRILHLNVHLFIEISLWFIDNAARYDGGGLLMWLFNNATIILSRISNNNATSVGGGGAYLYISNNVTIIQSQISNNTGYHGGGLYLIDYNNVAMFQSIISKNTARYYGGGLNLIFYNNATIIKSQISNNTARRGGGISFFSRNIASIINSQLTNNRGTFSGSYHEKYVGLDIDGPGNVLIVKNSTISNQGTHLDGLVKINPVEGTRIMKFPISRRIMKTY
eukprot:g7710.t1